MLERKKYSTGFTHYDQVIWIKGNQFMVGRYIEPCEESKWDNTPELAGHSIVALSALTGRCNVPNDQIKLFTIKLFESLKANPKMEDKSSGNWYSMKHDEGYPERYINPDGFQSTGPIPIKK